jgi:alkylation response protein AidB-like acyl-CoA dehydrogenase
MDFSAVVLTGAQQAFRDEVRAFLDEHVTAGDPAGIDNFDEPFYLALGARGWLMPRWRREDGGAELDDVRVAILEDELDRRDELAGTDRLGVLSTTRLVWPAIEASAEPGLRAELTPRVARGTARLTLGYSEPDGGSDIAGAKTRAVRDGDEWVINGQKIFTTNAQHSQYTFLITRTDPDLPKHQGLTMFLCPLDTPGIEIQALPTIGDERTNIVYYSDVRISDRYRVGEVNSGWAVLHGPLDAEHYIGGEASKLQDISGGAGHLRWLRRGVQAAARWAQDTPAQDNQAQDNQDSGGSAVSTDPVFLAGLGRILVQIEAGLATPGPMGRIKGADVAIAGCEQLIDLTGPAATLPAGADGAIDHGVIELAHRAVQVTATYGGTVEVFRTVVAQHYLGLPRPDYPGHKTFLSGRRPATTAA